MKTMLQLSNLLKVDIAVLLGVMACGGVKIMGTALFSVVFLRWCAFIILCVLCFCHCIDLCVCVCDNDSQVGDEKELGQMWLVCC